MKYFWVFCLLLTSLFLGCVHSKNQISGASVDANKIAILNKPKNIAEIFKTNFDHPETSITDLLDACSKDACDFSQERSVASRLKSLLVALHDKNAAQVANNSSQVVEDFHRMMGVYSDQREYIVPVTFQAWFLAGAIYPYSKNISKALFAEVKAIRKNLDLRSPKPVGYLFLVALDIEYQAGHLVDKVQAYKKCIDAEPSNRRCQESYLRVSAQSPIAIKASETNLAKECRPEVDKSGFTLRVGTSTLTKYFSGPKPFYGKKYYIDRQDLLGVSDIETIYWNKKGASLTAGITDSGAAKVKSALSQFKNKGLLLMKKEMIFAAAPLSAAFKDQAKQIKFLMVDKKGLNDFVKKCP